MVPFLSTFMLFCTLDRLIHRVQFESAVPLVLSRITIPTTVLISSNVQNNYGSPQSILSCEDFEVHD